MNIYVRYRTMYVCHGVLGSWLLERYF